MSLTNTASSDLDFVQEHRAVWADRPELRAVYKDFFARLLDVVGRRAPVVELGAGPGFLKEYCPHLISTDVIATRWVDAVCDGCALPFAPASVGAFVMLDVLHHLPHPLDFLSETARVLNSAGVVVMIEPWITPASYLLYRYFHHRGLHVENRYPPPLSNRRTRRPSTETPPFRIMLCGSAEVRPICRYA